MSSKFENVESFEATDDYTFVIKLKEASAGFLSLNIIAILPEGYEDQATAPVGTGPFKFVEYVPSQRVVLEKNPDYYDEDRMAQVGPGGVLHHDRLRRGGFRSAVRHPGHRLGGRGRRRCAGGASMTSTTPPRTWCRSLP